MCWKIMYLLKVDMIWKFIRMFFDVVCSSFLIVVCENGNNYFEKLEVAIKKYHFYVYICQNFYWKFDGYSNNMLIPFFFYVRLLRPTKNSSQQPTKTIIFLRLRSLQNHDRVYHRDARGRNAKWQEEIGTKRKIRESLQK